MRGDHYLQGLHFTTLSARHFEVDRCSMVCVNGQTLSVGHARRGMLQALINASDRRVDL